MLSSAAKTVRQQFYWQYAKTISKSSGFSKKDYPIIMSKWEQLCSGDINWSTYTREWLRERDEPNKCIHYGQEKKLTVEHILPKCCGGEDESYNTIMVRKSCNSSKGGKRLYEWKELDAKDKHHRIAEGKYLKYLHSLHERQGTQTALPPKYAPSVTSAPSAKPKTP